MKLRLLALGVLAVAISGCGIGTQDHARFEPDNGVPFDLLDTPTSTSITAPSPADGVTTRVCLVDPTDHIVAIAREMQPGFSLDDLVAVIGDGTTPAEHDDGWTSAFSSQDLVDSTSLLGGVAQVGLTDQFTTLPAADQLKAIAQLVCTFTEQRGIGQVQFIVGGSPAEVPRGDGSATADPVSRLDYQDLIGEPLG